MRPTVDLPLDERGPKAPIRTTATARMILETNIILSAASARRSINAAISGSPAPRVQKQTPARVVASTSMGDTPCLREVEDSRRKSGLRESSSCESRSFKLSRAFASRPRIVPSVTPSSSAADLYDFRSR